MAKKAWRVLTINPGSTSTKVALFEGDRAVFSKTVSHDAGRLAEFPTVSDQLSYRKQMIDALLEQNGLSLADVDAVVGRGGGLLPVEGGTYVIDELLLDHARRGANGVQHPAQLGSQLAHLYATECGAREFVVNPPDTDELQDVARVTGVRGINRTVHLHALNLKETAIRHAESIGRRYEDCNFVVCHLGGGVSVSAHRRGRMVDGFDIVGGDGPMAPTRCGGLNVTQVADYLRDHSRKELVAMCHRTGGFVSHLGTSDALEVQRRASEGDEHARMVWSAFMYQVEKGIGAMAAVLRGDVDGILLGGGIAHSEELVQEITDACGFIAPVSAYPGEFEMEAMAAGARRVLDGREEAKHYTGIPVWDGFDWDKADETAEGKGE